MPRTPFLLEDARGLAVPLERKPGEDVTDHAEWTPLLRGLPRAGTPGRTRHDQATAEESV